MALCEDSAETLRLLALVTIYVSFKDMAVAPDDEAYPRSSKMALGEGMLDLPGDGQGSPAENLRARSSRSR